MAVGVSSCNLAARLRFLLCAVAILAIHLSPAGALGAGVFLLGDQTVRASRDQNSAGTAEAFKATASTSGTVASVTVYVESNSAATKLTVGLYNASGTHPGALLTQGTLNAPVAGSWNEVPVPNATVTAGAVYWIAVLSPSGAGTLRFRDTNAGAAASSETSRITTLTSLPSTWTTGSTYSNAPLSAYASAASGPVLSVSTANLAFSGTVGGAEPAPASVTINNTGTETLSFAVATDAAWLTATPTNGTAPQALQISASIAGLAAGNYTGHVTITSPGSTGSPGVVTVTLAISAPPAPILSISTTALGFSAVAEGSNPSPQSFAVNNTGTGTLNFTTASDVPWLTAIPQSGTAPQTVQASVSVAGLTAGTYTAHITVSSPGIPGSPGVVTVTLIVSPPSPVLAVSPTTLSFTALVGAPNPAPASVNVTNTGTGTMSFSAATDVPWLTVTPGTGTAPQTLQVSASTVGQESLPLTAGTYTGHVTITAAGAQGSPKVITVTLTITQPILSVTPSTLAFNGIVGGIDPTPASLSVSNSGAGTLSFTAVSDAPWLSVGPANATAPQTLTVGTSIAGLVQGTYIGHVTIAASGAQNSPTVVTVTLTVAQPVLSVSPTTLAFTGTSGGTNPVAASINVTNTGTGTLNFTAASDSSWLTVTPATGTAPMTLQINAAIASLPAGTYTGHITVTSAGAQGSPVSIPVTLTLAQPVGPGAVLIGTQTVGSNRDDNPSGYAEAFKATATASGTITSISVYVDATSTATQLVTGLYASNGSHPGVLLTQGSLSAPVAGAWNTVPVPNATISAGVIYWIAILGPSGTLRFRDTLSGAAASAEASAQSTLTSLPATWTTGSSFPNAPLSAYASAASGPVLSVSPTSLAFVGKVGGNDPSAASLSVTNLGGSTLTFATALDVPWLTVTPNSGTAPLTMQVNASLGNLGAGIYVGHITATSTGALGSPSVTTVTLQVIGPPAKISLSPVNATVSARNSINYTATIQDAAGNTVADATDAVTFSVTGVAGGFAPASPIAAVMGKASAAFTPTSAGTGTITASAAGLTSGTASLTVLPSNAITLENQKPGHTTWQITNRVSSTTPEIVGYAGATSVNVGSTLPLMVSLNNPGQYTVEVYRLGWYAGMGGRLVYSSGTLSGVKQAACGVTNTITKLIECNWSTSHTLTLSADWTTGLYVANLTALSSGKQSQIWFVVRDDSSFSDIAFQSAFTTYQAYNNYGDGEQHSLYGFNSTNGIAAYKVSFDRPFAQVSITPSEYNKMTAYEYNMVRWMESQGYDVSYITNLDVHLNPAGLLQHKVYLSVGHDEYWSLEMRNAIEQARDSTQKVNLGFFSANTGYWRVRMEPSTSGVPNRVMVCYKDAALDPQGTTGLWRDPPNNRPENGLIGVMYVGDNSYDQLGGYDFVVTNSADPYYANTGLTNGTHLSQLVGYEWDAVVNNSFTPSGITILSSSPTTATTIAPSLPPGTSPNISNAVRYTAPSGAKVFATGSIQWMWGLDSLNTSPPRVDVRAQQLFVNVLSDMGARPLTPNSALIVP